MFDVGGQGRAIPPVHFFLNSLVFLWGRDYYIYMAKNIGTRPVTFWISEANDVRLLALVGKTDMKIKTVVNDALAMYFDRLETHNKKDERYERS